MRHLPNADLDALCQLWRRTNPTAPLPARSDFLPERDFRPWLGDLALAEVWRDPLRFRARLVGTRVAATDGRDVTGKFLDEAFADRYDSEIAPLFTAATESGQGIYSEIYFGRRLTNVSAQIVLPLAEDGQRVDMLLVGFAVLRRADANADLRMIEEIAAGRVHRKPLVHLPRQPDDTGEAP